MPGQPLDREEYIEQAYFFRVYRERLEENVPSQEILAAIHEEILATTKLPLAIQFLRGEVLQHGAIGVAMARLPHYFTPFQAFVMGKTEEDRTKFDQRVGLMLLEREAEFRAERCTPAGLFIYQFESISRNQLGYDTGMSAMAKDPHYDDTWSNWILKVRLQLGAVDFADLIWFHSEQWIVEKRRKHAQEQGPGGSDPSELEPKQPILFGAKEGRIAAANRTRDPLFMFAALQRQLGYPVVPRAQSSHGPERRIAQLEARQSELEKRLSLLESEQKGRLDLSQFYVKTPKFTDEGVLPGDS